MRIGTVFAAWLAGVSLMMTNTLHSWASSRRLDVGIAKPALTIVCYVQRRARLIG